MAKYVLILVIGYLLGLLSIFLVDKAVKSLYYEVAPRTHYQLPDEME